MSDKKILIADDDRDLAHSLELRCQQMGLEAFTVFDAMAALTVAHREQPDVICLDVRMPAGNGLSVCEMLKSDEKLASIPVIMLTGHTDEDTVRRCHGMCAYYVPKCPDLWPRVEPLLRELVDLPVAT